MENNSLNQEINDRRKKISDLEKRVRRDPKLRERVIATYNFDKGMRRSSEQENSFLFGAFVSDEGRVILVRNNFDEKDVPGGWTVLSCSFEDQHGPKVQYEEVTDKSCTRREDAAFLMPEGVDAIEVLNAQHDDETYNIFCRDDGTFSISDRKGNVYLPFDGLVGGADDQEAIDKRFEEIVKSDLQDVGEIALLDTVSR